MNVVRGKKEGSSVKSGSVWVNWTPTIKSKLIKNCLIEWEMIIWDAAACAAFIDE